MAKQQDKIVINDDYDTCLKLCQDANNAYISLLKDKEQIMDFTDYLSDSNLAEYVQYRAKNYPNGVCAASGSFYLTNYESISNECVFIKGQISIQNGSTVENLGEAAFVLKNENGRIVIEDWYHNDPDSLDVMYRANEYECIRYVDFWECDEKYGPFMERIKSKAE